MLLTAEEARRLADRILGVVKADDADVNVTSRIHRYLRFAANNFQTSGDRETRTASVTVWIAGRRGASTTSDLSDAALQQMVEQAQTLARLSPVDREYMPTLPQQQYESTRRYVEA